MNPAKKGMIAARLDNEHRDGKHTTTVPNCYACANKKYPVQRADGRTVLVTVPPRDEDAPMKTTPIENMSPQAMGDYYRERGEWKQAADAYHKAYMGAGGHRFAEMMRARAQECQAKADAMTPKHTPTPWLNFDEKIRGPETTGLIAECCDDSFPDAYDGPPKNRNISFEQAKDNAAFIVRAVNAYEKDQEVIKDLLATMKAIVRQHDDNCRCRIMAPRCKWIDFTDAAIAKAEASK